MSYCSQKLINMKHLITKNVIFTTFYGQKISGFWSIDWLKLIEIQLKPIESISNVIPVNLSPHLSQSVQNCDLYRQKT